MNDIRGLSTDPATLAQEDLISDADWGRECSAFNIQAELTAEALDCVAAVQGRLVTALPGQLAIPTDAMHISVLNLIHSRSVESAESKHARWADAGPGWLKAIGRVSEATPCFDVVLNRVVATPIGILVAAAASAEMVALRERLVVTCGLKIRPPELCHVTVLRFGLEPPPIALVRDALEGVAIDVPTVVDGLIAVQELVYPSLRRRTLRRFTLAGAVANG